MKRTGSALRPPFISWTLPNPIRECLRHLRWQYKVACVPAKHKQHELPPEENPDTLRRQLTHHGFPPRPFVVSLSDFERFVGVARYWSRPYYSYGHDAYAVEKYLEHFVALTLLQLSGPDVYIDIASDISPLPDIAQELFGTRSYRQDYAYQEGLHGDRIGSDACALPVSDEFANKMTLTCSYEHFEADRDMVFLHEAERVLVPGGRLCILPLYLSSAYHVRTNPYLDMTGLEFDDQAVVCCREDVHVRHARIYDVEHFLSRVVAHRGALVLSLYEITNAAAVDPSCYLRYALVCEKPMQH